MPTKRTNREILTRGDDIYARKKQKTHRVEEVTFDKDARTEYLTGFHKRKVQRREKAAERAKEQAHKEKLEERRQMREERKHQAAQELAKFNEAMKTLGAGGSDDEESSQDDSDAIDGDIERMSSDDDFSDWEGFEGNGKTNGILKKRQQYEDDDGETTVVTIEDISEPVPEAAVDLSMSKEVLEQSIHRAQEYAKMLGVGKTAKPKKKKFRYLTKSERKANNSKNNSRRSRRK